MQNIGRSALRVAKNYTKGYSDVQVKVRDATSNDPWGPSGSQMNEVAQATFNQQDFIEVMEVLDKRLNDRGKLWRHVYKALTLLDYLLLAGSENVVLYFKENMYIVKTLKEFQYIDDDGKDQGANVRQKAKDITNLLMDDNRMRQERKSRNNMTDRMSGRRPQRSDDDYDAPRSPRRAQSTPIAGPSREDQDLQRAIEESKRMARDDSANQRRNQGDKDLEEAIRLSKEEEDRRKQLLAGNNGGLFDDEAQKQAQANGWDSLLIDTAVPVQPQQTGYPQFASYNPYAQFAQQQQQQQEEYMRMQQQMEMQRQMEEQARYAQQMAQMEEQARYQQMMQAQQQQQQQPQMLIPQHTAYGSNNPFAPQQATSSPMPSMPQFSTPQPQMPASPAQPPRPQSQPAAQRPAKDDGKHAQLAAFLANRDDGMDTFGNTGALRYGHASGAQRLVAQSTGNPFAQQNQQQSLNREDQPFFTL